MSGLLKLTYSREADQFVTRTVIGDVDSIWDLRWQLTHNYKPQDGLAIGSIKVATLDGRDISNEKYAEWHSLATYLTIGKD